MEQAKSQNFLQGILLTITLIILGMVAFALRVPLLDRAIRHDEAHSYMFYVLGDVPKYLWDYTNNNNHIFHSLLMDVAVNVLGNAEWAIRIPVLIAGMLTLPVTYVLASRLYDRWTGLLAMGLVAVAAPLIEYSANARGYAIHTLLFLLQLIAAWDAIKKDNRQSWAALAILSALSFYTVPTAVFTMGVVTLWMLGEIWLGFRAVERRRRLRHLFLTLFAAGSVTILLYAPVLIGSGASKVTSNRSVSSLSSERFSHSLSLMPKRYMYFFVEWGRPNITDLPLLLAVLISLIGHRTMAKHRLPMHLLPIIVVVPIMFARQVVPPNRTQLPFLPLYLILVAAGIVYLAEMVNRRVKLPQMLMYCGLVLAMVSVFGNLVVYYGDFDHADYSVPNPDGEAIAFTLIETIQPGDIVISDGLRSISPRYYAYRNGFLLGVIWDEYNSPPDLLATPPEGRLFIIAAPIETMNESIFENIDMQPPPGDYRLQLVEWYSESNLYEVIPVDSLGN